MMARMRGSSGLRTFFCIRKADVRVKPYGFPVPVFVRRTIKMAYWRILNLWRAARCCELIRFSACGDWQRRNWRGARVRTAILAS